jgi:hypothetical protein
MHHENYSKKTTHNANMKGLCTAYQKPARFGVTTDGGTNMKNVLGANILLQTATKIVGTDKHTTLVQRNLQFLR